MEQRVAASDRGTGDRANSCFAFYFPSVTFTIIDFGEKEGGISEQKGCRGEPGRCSLYHIVSVFLYHIAFLCVTRDTLSIIRMCERE
jgi:hypothetical protein